MFPVLVSTNGRFIKHSGVEIKHRKPLKLIFEDECYLCRLIFDAKLYTTVFEQKYQKPQSRLQSYKQRPVEKYGYQRYSHMYYST